MAIWQNSGPQQAEGEEDEDDDVHQEEVQEEEEEDDDEDDGDDSDDDEDDTHFNEFSIALQELKSIRSHLYSAAEYCESAYMYSDQKQVIFENLKDYSVKALVNAVDHVGTVASKLNDLLSIRTKEMSVVEFNMSCLSQRLQAYHDRANWEGLNHYQHAKRRPRYGQHYALAGNLAGDSPNYEDKRWIIVQKLSQAGSTDQYQDDAASDSNPKSLAWHLASETPSVSSTTSTLTALHVNRSTSSNFRGDKKSQGFLSRSLSGGGQFSLPRSSPNFNTFNKIHEPVQSPGSSKSLSSLLSLDETKRHGHKKGLLSTFLGRTKSGKPKRLSTLTSFQQ